MKKNIIAIAALCTAMFGASAAELSIAPAVQIVTPDVAFHPTLSPDGSILLFSTESYSGLYSYDMNTKNVTMLDEGVAAGFEPIFAKDEKSVYYQTASIENKLTLRDVRNVTLKNGKVKQLKKPTRENIDIRSLAGNTTYVTTNENKIVLVIDGKQTELDPVENAFRYEWPSISPDGTKILFSEPYLGVYYCNLDGSGLVKVTDKGIYPCWLDNDVVLAVESRDEGYVVTSSYLRLYDLVTERSMSLTQEGTLVAELTTAPATGDVVYSTQDGKLYRTNIKITR